MEDPVIDANESELDFFERLRRQSAITAAKVAKKTERLRAMRERSNERLDRRKERHEEMVSARREKLDEHVARREEVVSATANRAEKLQKRRRERISTQADRLDKNIQKQLERLGAAKQRMSTKQDEVVSKTNDFMDKCRQTLNETPTPTRAKRTISDNSNGADDQQLEPTLKVIEQQQPYQSAMDALMQQTFVSDMMSNAQVNNDDQCRVCGLQKRNEAYDQPQFFELIQGRPVAYVPGQMTYRDSTKNDNEPRIVFDRLGHQYVELANGNLQLIMPQYVTAPQQPQQQQQYGEVQYSRPDNGKDAIAKIMSQNQEVIHQTNPFKNGQMIPKASDMIRDTIDFAHSLARREITKSTDKGRRLQWANRHDERDEEEREEDEKSQWSVNKEQEETANVSESKPMSEKSIGSQLVTRRMYQVLPFQQDNRDASMIVKVYSAPTDKNEEKPTAEVSESRANENRPRPKPTIQTVRNGNKEYDLLTIVEDPEAADSKEEIEKIIKELNERRREPIDKAMKQ